jgi:cysteine synthase
MKGAIARAEELVSNTPNAWMPQQFNNPRESRRASTHDGRGNLGGY